MEKKKTERQILEQTYMSADDLNIICPMCRPYRNKIINEVRERMEKENYFLPPGKTKLALTEFVKEKLGIKK